MPMSVVITFGLRRSKRQKRALSESSIVSETDGCGAIELWCQQWGSFSYQACCHHWCTEHSEYLVGSPGQWRHRALTPPADVREEANWVLPARLRLLLFNARPVPHHHS